MSKFKRTHSSSDSICPYCGYAYQVEAEDYSGLEVKEECFQCRKKYWREDEFSVEHETRPDCVLNGEEHDMKHDELVSKYVENRGLKALVCATCGKTKLVPL